MSFFDDTKENVHGARKFGVHVVLVNRGAESVLDGLKLFHVPVPDRNYLWPVRSYRGHEIQPPPFAKDDTE